MLRKSILALIAVAGVAFGSATDGYAFSGGGHGRASGHGGGFGGGYYGGYGYPYPYASSSYYSEDNKGCYMRVMTPYGWRVRHAHVCN
jgi:hypothetical protein